VLGQRPHLPGGVPRAEIMVPLVGNVNELKLVREQLGIEPPSWG